MFPLHYKTRRFLCRVAFVLLGLAPTAGVLVWAGWLGTSAHVDACRRQIEDHVHTAAKLAAVTHPRPGVAIYEGLELLEPHTRRRLAYLPRLQVATASGQLMLLATGPEIQQRGLSHLLTLIEEPRRATSPASLEAGSLIVHEADREQYLKDVRVARNRTTDGDEFELHFRLAAVEAPQPTRLRLVRQRDSRVTNLVELDTGGGKLPCDLAASLVPWLAHLGPQATFQGTLNLTRDRDGWDGNVQGTLEQIDLTRAIAANFSHQIDGLADLQIARSRISQSRLAEVTGSISAGPGMIGPSLRLAAAEALQLTASPLALQPDGVLEYEHLAFDFALDADGVWLTGRCAQAPAGALLIDRRQMLLGQPRQQPQPLSALIRALTSPGPGWVPATPQAAWLLEFLPIQLKRSQGL